MNNYTACLQVLLICSGIFISALFSAADASPWARGEGRLFLSTRAEYYAADGEFLLSTPTEDRFERYETRNFIEYGLSEKITLGATVVYGASTVRNEVESRTDRGFSEIEGFVQHQLFATARSVGSVRIAGLAPARFDTGAPPDVQSEGPAIEARFLYGRTLTDGPVKLFAAAEIGYQHRIAAAADQTRLDVTLGFEPTKRVLLLLQSFNTRSVRNEDPGGNDFDIYKIAPSIVVRLRERWAVQGGVVHEYAGRNISTGDTFHLGLWTSF